MAAALVDGQVGPRQVLPPRIFDDFLLELADRVEVEIGPEFEELFPQKTYAEVIVHTEDGRELSSGPVEPIWEPPDDLPTDNDLEKKFVGLVGPVLGTPREQEIAKMIWKLEKMDGMMPLINGCIRDRHFDR